MPRLIQIENDEECFSKSKPATTEQMMTRLNAPIIYSIQEKKFNLKFSLDEGDLYMGSLINSNQYTQIIDVLYKDFLLKDPIKIPAGIKDRYMQTFIKKKYDTLTSYIISKMPRIKKLKRINLKMIDHRLAYQIAVNFNEIVNSHQMIYGYEASQLYKAKLATMPFYVNDNGIIKIYRIDTNTLELPEYEGANFLSYFSFKY